MIHKENILFIIFENNSNISSDWKGLLLFQFSLTSKDGGRVKEARV